MYVTKLVGIMFGLIFLLDVGVAIGWSSGFAIFIYVILLLSILVLLLIISRQPQNRYKSHLSVLQANIPKTIDIVVGMP